MFLMIGCICLAGCENVSASEPVTASVTEEDNYGDLRLNLKEIDLEYGDSVNISFSGGYEIREVPFYPDFYGRINTAILTDYFDTLSIAHNFNRAAGIKIGEEVKISLEQTGRYKNEYEAYNVPNAKIQARGQSDEAFRNASEVTPVLCSFEVSCWPS